MLRVPPEISVIIVSHNSAAILEDCLHSILQDLATPCEIIVVDNASQDESCQIVEDAGPAARLLRLDNNLGYGAACNAGAQIARGGYLVFLNPDTVVESGWLEPLISTLSADATVGAVSPKIVLMSDPSTINTCGNDVQFVGFPSCHLFGVKASTIQKSAEVTAVSGAAFAIGRKLFEQLGGFDPGFFMYLEDTDLSWRLRLSGYRCSYVPQSVVRHHYAARFPALKFFHLEHNRYQLLLKNLRRRTLLALLPALAVAEVSTWAYAFLRGPEHIVSKLRALLRVARQWRWWRHVHSARVVKNRIPDQILLQMCSTRFAYGTVYDGWVARMAAALLDPVYLMLRSLALILLAYSLQRRHAN